MSRTWILGHHRIAAVGLALALVTTGCGGGRTSRTSTSSVPGTTADVTGTTTEPPGAPTGTGTTAGTAGTATIAGTTPSATASRGSTATSPSATGGAATPAPGPTRPVPPPTVAGPANKAGGGAPLPAAPGTYRYRQSGTTTIGTSTKPVPAEGGLKIDPASGDGNQVSHRSVDPSQAPSDTVYAFRNGGVFIVQIVMRANAGGQTQTFTCTFAPPLPSPPWPPKVGSTFAGHADCGTFTLDVSGSVPGTKDVTLDGTTHHTFVIDATIAIHGQIEGSGTQTAWLDPATSLVLHEQTSQKGTYGKVVSFNSSLTADLESAHPA